MTALDALLGTISHDGVELELGSGLNFTGGVTLVRNAATGKVDIAISGGGGGGGGGSGHTIEDNGVAVTPRTTLNLIGFAVADVAGKTQVKRRDGTAAGQQLFWDGSAWQLVGPTTGSALGDASVTLQFTTAAQYFWPAATNTTAIRTLTLGTTGLAAGPNAGVGAELTIDFLRGLTHNVAVANGGGGGGTLFTIPASSGPFTVTFFFDGTNWSLAGWKYLTTVSAA